MTATASSPSTQRAAPASVRLDSASPKNRHRMTAATTTTTATSAAITPRLTPRLPVATARWLPVHSPPSHSPLCLCPDDRGGGSGASPELRLRLRMVAFGPGVVGSEVIRLVVVGFAVIGSS